MLHPRLPRRSNLTILGLITTSVRRRRNAILRDQGIFPDLFARMPWLVRGVLLCGMLFFGRREVNEFIYFAF